MNAAALASIPCAVRFAFTLPWPPTNNNMFANAAWGKGGRRLSKKGRAYADRVGELALMNHVPRHKLQGRLGIGIIAHAPDRGRHDLDNLWKAVLDSLTKCGCVPDDSDFDVEFIARGTVIPGGRLEVEIWQIQAAVADQPGA